jgi:pimeloyl-ACP methyl ester carboxylesterase
MSRPKRYIISNGVRTNSNDLQSWHFRAARWVDDNTDAKGDTYHYAAPGSLAWHLRKRHVERLGQCLYDTSLVGRRDVVFVGHSWSTDLFARAMERYPVLRVHSAHLIGGAAQESFKTNGLNAALRAGRLGRVAVYFNPGDPVLLGHRWWKYLGYGKLGLNGPTDVAADVAHLVTAVKCPGVGHSGYFAGDQFARTMRMVTADPDAQGVT